MSFQGVVLCTKTAIKHRFFNLVLGQWMDLRNSNGIGLRSFYFATIWKLFSKIFTRSGKMHHAGISSGISESSK